MWHVRLWVRSSIRMFQFTSAKHQNVSQWSLYSPFTFFGLERSRSRTRKCRKWRPKCQNCRFSCFYLLLSAFMTKKRDHKEQKLQNNARVVEFCKLPWSNRPTGSWYGERHSDFGLTLVDCVYRCRRCGMRMLRQRKGRKVCLQGLQATTSNSRLTPTNCERSSTAFTWKVDRIILPADLFDDLFRCVDISPYLFMSKQQARNAVSRCVRRGRKAKSCLTFTRHIKTAEQRAIIQQYCTWYGTLAVDGWAVTFGTARRGLGGLRPRPVPSSLYQRGVFLNI